jgi:hypothetical protein
MQERCCRTPLLKPAEAGDTVGQRALTHEIRDVNPRPSALVVVVQDCCGSGGPTIIHGVPNRSTHMLHIPVGGRRFRPSLEDFIESPAVHDLIVVHDGYRAVIARHRVDWLRLQLQAAVRNDPDAAIEQLHRMGYDVNQRLRATTT